MKNTDKKATGSQYVTTQHEAHQVMEKQEFIDPEKGPEKKKRKNK